MKRKAILFRRALNKKRSREDRFSNSSKKRKEFIESCKKRNSDLSFATIVTNNDDDNYENATVGKNVVVNDAFLDLHGKITLGDNVFFGWGVKILTGTHDIRYTGPKRQFAISSKPVTLETGVWVASFAIILPGSVVGMDSVVSAGSVVKGTFPPKAVIQGNPARIVDKITPIANQNNASDSINTNQP